MEHVLENKTHRWKANLDILALLMAFPPAFLTKGFVF